MTLFSQLVPNASLVTADSTQTLTNKTLNSPILVTPNLGAANATIIATNLGLVGTPSYTFTGDLNTGMWSPAADTIAFSEGGAEVMRINSSGNVGIGDTNPAAKFVVNGGVVGTTAGNLLDIVTVQGTAGTNGVGIRTRLVRASNGTDWTTTVMRLQGRVDVSDFGYIDLVSGGAHGMAFGSGTNERMRINSAGNVGIGTTPATRLHAKNSFDGLSVISTFENNSNVSSNTAAAVDFKADQATSRLTSFRDGAGTSSSFAISTSLASVVTEAMRITSAGNVGIGTTTPGIYRLRLDSGSTEKLRLYNSVGNGNTIDFIDQGWQSQIIGSAGNLLFNVGGTSEKMRLDNSGNLGIGTTVPNAQLAVIPTVNPTSATGTLQTAIGEATNNASYQMRMGYNSSYQGIINVLAGGGGADLLLNPTGGNVGLGTSTPNTKLEILATSAGATVEVLRLNNSGGGANTAAQIKFNAAGTNYASITGGYGAAAPQMTFNLPAGAGNYVWQQASAESMRIDSSGFLGIGTSAPAKMLSVYQNQGGLRLSHNFLITDYSEISVTTGGLTGTSAMIRSYRAATDGFGNEGDLRFYTNTGLTSGATDASERMRIDQSGNVGIGTTAPTNTLTVQGTVAFNVNSTTDVFKYFTGGAGLVYAGTTTATAIGFITSGGERMRISSTGSLGIGTSAPTARLSIVPTTNPTSATGGLQTAIGEASDNAAYQMRMGYILDTTYKSVINSIAGGAGADLLLNPSGGNVGIGRTPLGKFDVFAGAAGGVTYFYGGSSIVYSDIDTHVFRSAAGAERMQIDSSGNVLVGTSSSGGIATNTARLIGGIHATVRSSASVASGTTTTLVTLPAGEGIYIVTAALQNSSTPGSYSETAIVSISQSASSIAVLVNPYNLNLSISGLNLQVVHTQGGTQTIQFSVLRLL